MRGKVTGLDSVLASFGITPAYAGKRLCLMLNLSHLKDHPRLCGEKAASYCAKRFVVGSPPPMRGKADSPIMANVAKGITPAYAGKSYGYYTIEVSF